MSARATLPLSFAEIAIEVRQCGNDLVATVSGGAAHVGCAVLAIPRPSLAGDGSAGCDSSVLVAPGHKDEAVVRPVAEALCRASGRTVACTGGVHVDGATCAHLAEVAAAVPALCDAAVALLSELD